MKNKNHSSVRTAFIRISKIHLVIALILIIQTIVYDAGKLITPELVLKRWIVISILALAASACWYLARLNSNTTVIRNLVWALVAADFILASFSIYTQRGMASRGVFLLILPILTAAALQRKGAIFLTAAAAAVVYMVTAVAYFVLNFNEGYKLELYGEIGFYSALLLATGAIAWALVRHKH